MKEIVITRHAATRILVRGNKYGLNEQETIARVERTISNGQFVKKSRKHKTKYLYFNDNISFYVIFEENEETIQIKTVIIKKGRK